MREKNKEQTERKRETRDIRQNIDHNSCEFGLLVLLAVGLLVFISLLACLTGFGADGIIVTLLVGVLVRNRVLGLLAVREIFLNKLGVLLQVVDGSGQMET
jgi:hypothetical protein